MEREPVLIIQGGAGRVFKNLKRRGRVRRKMVRILNQAYEKLWRTNASLEAVTYAVQLMEDDPEFNAGTGSQLQADGRARLSASIMEGFSRRFAAVINIEKIKNPIQVARALLREKDRVLAGPGAFKFAKQLGMQTADPRTPHAIRRWEKHLETSCDTVGACALDWKGMLASATSTGGRGFERPGRVSDSAMPVANYADTECAISATGIGEDIIEEGLAVKIAARVQDGFTLRQAFEKTFKGFRPPQRQIGAVGLDIKGKVMWLSNTEMLIYAWKKGSKIELF